MKPLFIDSNNRTSGIFTSNNLKLEGKYSILNRSVVMHEFSAPEAGPRQSCGKIEKFVSGVEDFEPIWAVAHMGDDGDLSDESGCKGLVEFFQYSELYTTIRYNLDNCPPEGDHGFHVHEDGDLTNGCASTGGHYKPDADDSIFNMVALKVDANGHTEGVFTTTNVKLNGPHSVMNRGVVMHEFSSNAPGGPGPRQSCGIVEKVERNAENGGDFKQIYAMAAMGGSGKINNVTDCHGLIEVVQYTPDLTSMTYNLVNCPPPGQHGFHIHEEGDINTDGCLSTGGHYKPDSIDHIFNMTPLEINEKGNSMGVLTTDSQIKLDGDYSVLGRAFVLHVSGYPEPGPRQSCGLIEKLN